MHPKVAACLNNLGASGKAVGNGAKAIQFCRQALEINEKIYGQDHPNVVWRLCNLGATKRALKQPNEAIQDLTRAIEIGEKIYGKEHPKIAECLNLLGNAWVDLGNKKEALRFFEQAYVLALRLPNLGPEHATTKKLSKGFRKNQIIKLQRY